LADVVNESLNATMPRTLNTSISTLLVLLVIFFFGGASIQSFIFAMLLGVVVDPLTTIFLAVPAAYYWMGKKEAKAEAVAKK
jgi:SecD/SecF fusion protein